MNQNKPTKKSKFLRRSSSWKRGPKAITPVPGIFIYGNYSKENQQKMDELDQILDGHGLMRMITITATDKDLNSQDKRWKRNSNSFNNDKNSSRIQEDSQNSFKFFSPIVHKNTFFHKEYQEKIKRERFEQKKKKSVGILRKKRSGRNMKRINTEKVDRIKTQIKGIDKQSTQKDSSRVPRYVSELDRFSQFGDRINQMKRGIRPKFIRGSFHSLQG